MVVPVNGPAETRDFDASLLDVMMPDMGGVDLVGRLRAARMQTPLLMLIPVASSSLNPNGVSGTGPAGIVEFVEELMCGQWCKRLLSR